LKGSPPAVGAVLPVPNVIDFSRNSIEEQDTYMKLINVNTFESLDYGIGIKRSVSQATSIGQPKRRKRNQSPPLPNFDSGEGGETGNNHGEQLNEKKLIVRQMTSNLNRTRSSTLL
jgi:hypothetical protein